MKLKFAHKTTLLLKTVTHASHFVNKLRTF